MSEEDSLVSPSSSLFLTPRQVQRDASIVNLSEMEMRSHRSPPHYGSIKQDLIASRSEQGLLVNITSGVVAFLLSSTLAVSCASVIVGHGTPMDQYIAHFIDMNFLGTAILCLVLAFKSSAPWSLGAIDVFVVPVMAQMALKITKECHQDMTRAVPTTIVMVSMVSFILGGVFYIMGIFRVTSFANYMPYPVIAGFLSGIGAELLKNGLHMASENVFSIHALTWKTQQLVWPAILFAVTTRLGQYWKWPITLCFPSILAVSVIVFHTIRILYGYSMNDLSTQGLWVFPWPADVIRATPMWFPWTNIDFHLVEWRILSHEMVAYMVSLAILGALKYSVSTTSLSTLFARDINADIEMQVIGIANIVSGILGCCGGCHYLSAMGIMKQFRAHERIPAVICALLLLLLWYHGIRLLQFVPKFVFGGLVLSVGVHFIETYFIAPMAFLKRLEQGMVIGITISFLVVGMLEAVALGVLISMMDLIYRIHHIGCVQLETTGQFLKSQRGSRTTEQIRFLEQYGHRIFILRLQGYLFFGTSIKFLERIENILSNLPCVQFIIVDLAMVPNIDATGLLHVRKVIRRSEQYGFHLYFCGLNASTERALLRNEKKRNRSNIIKSNQVVYMSGDLDMALEQCENVLLSGVDRNEQLL